MSAIQQTVKTEDSKQQEARAPKQTHSLPGQAREAPGTKTVSWGFWWTQELQAGASSGYSISLVISITGIFCIVGLISS